MRNGRRHVIDRHGRGAFVDAEEKPDPDQAWKALSLVNDWVRHAETKVIATLAAAGVSGGLLYKLAHGWDDPSLAGVVLGYGTLVMLVWTAWSCAQGLIPQRNVSPGEQRQQGMTSPDDQQRTVAAIPAEIESTADVGTPPEEPVNLLFYSDIVKAYGHSKLEYSEVLASLTRDHKSMTQHIAQQVWANASVAERKYDWANRAIVRLLISWLLLAGLAYVRVVFG